MVMIAKGEQAFVQPVEVVTSRGSRAVIGEGLNPGDQLIVKGHTQLVDGVKIKINPPPESKS